MKRQLHLGSWFAIALIITFLFAPVVLVVLFSFNSGTSTGPPLDGLSLRWYQALFADSQFVQALLTSVSAALLTMTFVVIAGTAAALALSRRSSRILDALSSIVVAPLVVPGLFLGVALFSFLNEVGVPLSLLTIVISHSLVTVPLVVLIVNARLTNIDRSILEAARDLGAGAFEAFWKILMPAITPAIIGAALLVIAWSMDEVILTLWTNGGNPTVPVLIWSRLRIGIDPSVNAIASIVLLVTTVAATIATRFVSTRELTG